MTRPGSPQTAGPTPYPSEAGSVASETGTEGGTLVSDEAVEAAARADHEHGRMHGDQTWDELTDGDRATYLAAAEVYLRAAVPLIVAPIEQRHERALLQEIEQRDENHEWADKLAQAIAKAAGVDIGEHSTMNDPWVRALDAVPLIAAQAMRQAVDLISSETIGVTASGNSWLDEAMDQERINFGKVRRALNGRADELEREARQ